MCASSCRAGYVQNKQMYVDNLSILIFFHSESNYVLWRHLGMIANVHIKIGSNSYEKVKNFKYLGSFLTNQNSIQEEIKM